MSLRSALQARMRRARWVMGALTILLALSVAVFIYILRGQDLPAALVANRIVLFALWQVNGILILAVLFVLLRNLLKLAVESRRGILGARLRTKLVATYIGLALGPVLLLFFYGTSVIQVQSERLFSAPVGEVLTQGNAVAQAMIRASEESAARAARGSLGMVESVAAADQRVALDRVLRRLLQERGLEFIAFYEGGELVQAVVDPQSGLTNLPDPGRSLLEDALRVGQGPPPTRPAAPLGAAARMTFAAAAARGESPSRPVLVTGELLDPAVARQTEGLVAAYQQFRQLELQRSDLRANDFLLFLLVTLLILLVSSWVGFYLARRVTVPILALAEATRRISEGDFSHRVEVEADDELRRLVGSFNEMTTEVERGRALLEDANRGLSSANERLAEERSLLAAVLGGVAAGVVSIDRSGAISTCNDAALQMLGQSEQAVVGRQATAVWSDPQRSALLELLRPRPGEAAKPSLQIRLRLEGETRTIEAKTSPLRGEDGAPAGQVLVLEDLSELLHAQQSATWSEAAKRIAHEIKNPLTPIQLAAERLLRKSRQGDSDLPVALEEAVATIQREVDSMKRMVEEFSRFARMPQPRPAQVDVVALVEDVARLYRDLKAGVSVDTVVAPDARQGWFDREQIKQVLLNLVDNAVEATEPPGRVRIHATADERVLRLRVEDEGRGIPPEARDKLFTPYFSTKGRGSGLGLAIVQRIVAEHQGTVRLEDRTSHGASLVVELPR